MTTSIKAVWAALVAVIVGLGATSAYSLSSMKAQRNRAEDLATYNVALRESLTQVQNQLQSVSQKMDALETERRAAAAPAAARTNRVAAARPAAVNDPRWKQMQDRLAEQQKQLEGTQKDVDSTRQDLASTRDDIEKTRQDWSGRLDSTRDSLSGDIARNHDELVALQKRGERNYFEFTIDKSKKFQKVGPVSLSLRKADTKHKYFDVQMLVEDQTLEKKHINLFEPVMFRLTDQPQALELVVNEITKDQVKGYLSAPKYKNSELASTRE